MSGFLYNITQKIKKYNESLYPSLKDTTTIVSDHVKVLNNPIQKVEINNLLLLSGGGVSAIVFTLGSIGTLVDNGLFCTYDVIGSVSGGSVVLHYIDLCYKYGLVGKKNWYNKYVRKPVYKAFVKGGLLNILTTYGYEIVTNSEEFLTKCNKKIFPLLFSKKKKLTNEELKNRYDTVPKLLFNYVNVNTNIIDYDHSDIENDPNFYIKRMLRCCSTILNFTFQNKSTYDCAIVDSIAMSKILNQYKIAEYGHVCLVSVYNRHIYKSSKTTSNMLSLFNVAMNLALLNVNIFRFNKLEIVKNINHIISFVCVYLFSVYSTTNSSANFMNILDGSEELSKTEKILSFVSSDLHPSVDKVHHGLFHDSNYENNFIYKTLLLVIPSKTNQDMCRLFENEGYIQLYSQLKEKTGKVFNIPNKKQYSRKRARRIYKTFKEKDVINNVSKLVTNVQDYFAIQMNKLGITSTPLTVENTLNININE
jgi:ribosomal protein S8